ncbi:MAG: hypothetical protein NC489_12940 [Ruminococcus flavefaciens]|nr:hypothetical protein [Ruminococcus flavefaciens]
MSKILMFLNEAQREKELFYSISNFLSKFVHKIDIKKEDVVNIKSKVIEEYAGTQENRLMGYVIRNGGDFRDINKPENIHGSLDELEVLFCVLVKMDMLYDVSELCNLILLKQYYKDLKIFLLIQGEQRDYHRVSLFLATMSGDENFYNSVFYHCLSEGFVQRLQKNSIGALRRFLPIQKINHESLRMLTARTVEYIPFGWLESLLEGKEEWKEARRNELLYGSLSLVFGSRSCFPESSIHEILDIFAYMNVLSWFFFAYALREFGAKKKTIEIEQLKEFVRQIKLYANGCLQLMENVVFHSEPQEGVFSFRICKGESNYIQEKYGEKEEQDTSFLEVIIADYSDGFHKHNIAQNFIDHIENPELKNMFEDMKPIDFFSVDDVLQERNRKRWIAYYDIEENIGRHFGIRIFENIVRQSKGKFTLESHAEHRTQEGESNKKAANEVCLPGTEYTILLPIKELQKKLLHTDIGIDKDINIEEDVKHYFNYRIINRGLEIVNRVYKSDVEKRAVIGELSDCIIRICQEEAPEVWFVKAFDWKAACGEILCKALLLSKCSVLNMPHLVLYDCENDFVDACVQSMTAVFRNKESAYALTGNGFQIAMFEKGTFDEVILIPDSQEKTIWINEQINISRNIVPFFYDISERSFEEPFNFTTEIIPFDVLCPIQTDGKERTLFECFMQKTIEKDIQERAFGCRISDTHMRLGSTVHVNLFYEAELLFGNKLFVSRLAYLIAKNLSEKLKEVQRLTIYGYATYSELLVFEVMNIIKNKFDIEDVDYAILEREMENRGDSHIDRIRYSYYEDSVEKRKEHFRGRPLVCIVPIASTLKTNERLISLFCNQNGEECANNVIEHYALVLVGPDKGNEYWVIREGNRIHSKRKEWRGIEPQYFIKVNADYEEAMKCDMCFPDNVLNEKPLIEVNAASTIPNQAFGLYGNVDQDVCIPSWEKIEKEQSKLECLKKSMIYSHVKRGENHFLYYFQTEKLTVQNSQEITGWLKKIYEQLAVDNHEYHVIFCPSHFSNAGFLELINRIVFHNAAIIIRDDVDKEYRSNIMAKYSNVYLLFKHLEINADREKYIKFYYVDDSIITGRTFWRAKSLVEAVAELYTGNYKKNKVHIFEKIFVLVDRNSTYSKMQYLRSWDNESRTIEAVKEDFFAFRSVKISSLRNHGDSCVICKLRNEAEILCAASSTLGMAKHWKNEKDKFRVKTLKKYLVENKDLDEESRERAYRRMVCTHTVHTYIGESVHGNHKEKAVEGILQLLLTDYMNRPVDRFEYFLSYLKVMSRPFIVFNKSMKQAVFDVLLLFTEWQLSKRKMIELIDCIGKDKEYLQKKPIRNSLLLIEEQILSDIAEPSKKKDLVLMLLKQLTELKSNYIIRACNMNKIADYVETLSKEDSSFFYHKYLQLVKLLIGVNSDTSKSAWLDYLLHHNKEYDAEEYTAILLPESVLERMYLENTRVLFDGIKKLCGLFKFDDDVKQSMEKSGGENTGNLQEEKVIKALTDYQYGNFKQVLRDYQYIQGIKNPETDLGRFTVFGKKWIFNSMMLLQLLNEEPEDEKEETAVQDNQEEILKKCHFIVVLLKNIIQADNVKIVMEADAEYNEWIQAAYGLYNDLVAKYQKRHMSEVEILEMPSYKEYIPLADSKSIGSGMKDYEEGLTARLQSYRNNKQVNALGYLLNDEESYLIWEMNGGREHPIFIYAELNREVTGWNRRSSIRNGMMFNQLLNERIFSNNGGGQLYELIINSRDLRMSNRSKAHSHTKNDVRMKQFEQVCKEERYHQYYQSNILTLLADLNVSEIYRKSLKKDYYLDSCDVKTIRWDDETSIFNRGIDFYYIADKIPDPVKVDVKVQKIFNDDEEIGCGEELLCYNVANAGREITLLLYSLILNAGVAGRSCIKDHAVKVYLSKTPDGNLRIANLAGQSQADTDEINKDLKYPPANEEKGISLWSMSRYIKGIIYSILHMAYERLDAGMEHCQKRDIDEYKISIEQLLESEFEVKADWIMRGEEKYFSLEVPVLAEKYQRFLKLFNDNRQERENEKISVD